MKRMRPTVGDGITAAERLKKVLQKRPDIHVHNVFLFGSVARNESHPWSDIDVAVVCDQFDRSKVKEAMTFYALDPGRDVRMSLVVLHPEDMQNKYLTIAREIEREGLPV
ncbi:MAG: nucleotidyltransferase domain-containing protein [Patescibacteria group bacterium]